MFVYVVSSTNLTSEKDDDVYVFNERDDALECFKDCVKYLESENREKFKKLCEGNSPKDFKFKGKVKINRLYINSTIEEWRQNSSPFSTGVI
jgi:hypothetical protein